MDTHIFELRNLDVVLGIEWLKTLGDNCELDEANNEFLEQ